jgi:hypothetical protein
MHSYRASDTDTNASFRTESQSFLTTARPKLTGWFHGRSRVAEPRSAEHSTICRPKPGNDPTLAEGWDIGEIVEAMSDAEQYPFGKGIEAARRAHGGLGPDGRRRAPDRLN